MSAALQDTGIILALIFALFAGAIAILVHFIRRTTPLVVFDKNCELKNFGVGEDRHFLIASRRRPAWFAGTLIGLLLLGLLGRMSERDADARREAALLEAAAQREHRLGHALVGRPYFDADLACLGTNAPPAAMIFFSARQADGGKPRFGCQFIGLVALQP